MTFLESSADGSFGPFETKSCPVVRGAGGGLAGGADVGGGGGGGGGVADVSAHASAPSNVTATIDAMRAVFTPP
jgi:hypothetical protein